MGHSLACAFHIPDSSYHDNMAIGNRGTACTFRTKEHSNDVHTRIEKAVKAFGALIETFFCLTFVSY